MIGSILEWFTGNIFSFVIFESFAEHLDQYNRAFHLILLCSGLSGLVLGLTMYNAEGAFTESVMTEAEKAAGVV